MGRSIGLDNPICARNVGLDITPAEPQLYGREPLSAEVDEVGIIGDDAPEFSPFGIVIGNGIGTREDPPGVRGPNSKGCDSRRRDTDGETARRLVAVGYGS